MSSTKSSSPAAAAIERPMDLQLASELRVADWETRGLLAEVDKLTNGLRLAADRLDQAVERAAVEFAAEDNVDQLTASITFALNDVVRNDTPRSALDIMERLVTRLAPQLRTIAKLQQELAVAKGRR
jgi:hypothetical protein